MKPPVTTAMVLEPYHAQIFCPDIDIDVVCHHIVYSFSNEPICLVGFWIVEYEFKLWIAKFNMMDTKWRCKVIKRIRIFVTFNTWKFFWIAEYEFELEITKFKISVPIWTLKCWKNYDLSDSYSYTNSSSKLLSSK